MSWQKFSGASIALLGAGKENLSLVRHLSQYTKNITLLDRRQLDEQLSRDLRKRFPFLKIDSGDDYLSNLNYDFLFRSPGLPINEVRPKIRWEKTQLTSPLELFLELSPTKKVIGVTGTKGKGTTCSMIFSICSRASKNCFLAGNIGQSIFDHWEKINEKSIVIMEMSSFQLEDVKKSPCIAVLLPLEKDHLEPLSEISPNFHASYKDYIEAKANITKYQSEDCYLIYISDNPEARAISQKSKANKLAIGFSGYADYKINNNGWFRGKYHQYNLLQLGLRGRHLLMDGALAIMAGEVLSIDKKEIEEGIKGFKSLPHRFEHFYSSKGVDFIDDSYATTPSSTIYAFEAIDRPIHWIAGGSRKGADFTQLAGVVASSRLAGIYLIGEEADRLEEALKTNGVDKQKINKVALLEEAVQLCLKHVKEGEVVLLSPACASKDMFTDAAKRGERFKSIVYESGF